jgi:fructose-1,6-bisphosphatase/inositol monophosphatase family enzyme
MEESSTAQANFSALLRIAESAAREAGAYLLQMIGTAATDLVFVACSRADVLVNHATAPWNIEAGKLILLEARGKATTTRVHDRTVAIYSNSILHQEIEDLFFC